MLKILLFPRRPHLSRGFCFSNVHQRFFVVSSCSPLLLAQHTVAFGYRWSYKFLIRLHRDQTPAPYTTVSVLVQSPSGNRELAPHFDFVRNTLTRLESLSENRRPLEILY